MKGSKKKCPTQLQKEYLFDILKDTRSFKNLKDAAKKLVDRTKIKNEKQKLERTFNPFGTNFESVIMLQKQFKNEDEYVIYQINGDVSIPPLFVFKTSRYIIELTWKVDKNGNHYLANEWVFFDDSHKRCKCFKTLTVSIYHLYILSCVKWSN